MKCVSCNYQNQEGAKFCRSCGAKLELSAIIKQTASLVKCVSCGSDNVASAKFCAKCGKKMTAEASPIPATLPQAPREPEPVPVRTVPATHQGRTGQPDTPVSPQKVAPNRKGIYVSLAIAIALIAIGGGGYFVIQDREQQRLALEKANEEKQRALAAAEQARKQAEEQAAKLVQQKEEAEAKQKELEAQRREAELKQREAEVKRQTADVKLRETEAKRMELEAKEREAAAARARQKATASAPSPAPQTAPRANTPQRVTVQQACANRGNVITRGICEVTECMKSANNSDPICVRGRETAEKNR